uniref:Uncharacterized protein n=1 Tax=Cacopsylla melanoneura TaxID=428564 RepID=A0A8D8M618_9HEMI
MLFLISTTSSKNSKLYTICMTPRFRRSFSLLFLFHFFTSIYPTFAFNNGIIIIHQRYLYSTLVLSPGLFYLLFVLFLTFPSHVLTLVLSVDTHGLINKHQQVYLPHQAHSLSLVRGTLLGV